ncbi:hypothetical protein HPP92_024555 [Vanilla planifolia]|uniref:J domain-containing protein n=1 Tax=Vanilla planifolia TaxID=51239 RepID=A0A835PM62_VANPL|nr:hypothetical protein HPP92_024555 [Vanilla planifolia]
MSYPKLVPNCGNSCIFPSWGRSPLTSLGTGGHPQCIPASARRRRLPAALRAAAGDGGAIKEMATTTGSFYELLGIPESGSSEDVKKAYKQLARKYHPDVSPPDRMEEYTRRFIEVHEAYETLSDPCTRALYDRHLARGPHLAFSARRKFDEELEKKSGWKSSWEDQLLELKRRSMAKNSDDNLSWGARMRRRRAENSAD